MVLAYLGVTRSQQDLARLMGARRYFGAPYTRVIRLQSPDVNAIQALNGDIDTLRGYVGQGLPVIVFVQAGEMPHWRGHRFMHALVVVGVDQASVTVLDPDPGAPPGPIAVPIGDLELAWDEMDRAYAVLSRLGSQPPAGAAAQA